jgi:hypothetical protein
VIRPSSYVSPCTSRSLRPDPSPAARALRAAASVESVPPAPSRALPPASFTTGDQQSERKRCICAASFATSHHTHPRSRRFSRQRTAQAGMSGSRKSGRCHEMMEAARAMTEAGRDDRGGAMRHEQRNRVRRTRSSQVRRQKILPCTVI